MGFGDDDAPLHHFPVWVLGDGNCLPRTLSILAFGHLENFVEMRMRIVAELTINIARYVSPSYLANGSTATGATLLEYLKLDVDIPVKASHLLRFFELKSSVSASHRQTLTCGGCTLPQTS